MNQGWQARIFSSLQQRLSTMLSHSAPPLPTRTSLQQAVMVSLYALQISAEPHDTPDMLQLHLTLLMPGSHARIDVPRDFRRTEPSSIGVQASAAPLKT